MRKIFIILLSLIVFYSCKQFIQNAIQESYLPDLENKTTGNDSLENGNWRYTKDDNLVKTGNYKDGYKTGPWKYNINDRLYEINWGIYQNDLIKINYPKNWIIEKSENYLFYSITDRETKDFFLINRHNKNEHSINLDDYLSEAVSELSLMTNEKVVNYVCVKLEYEKRNAYYLRFNTENDNDKWSYYTFYTEDGDFIYDSTFKVSGESKKLNKEIFGAMVYSLGVGEQKMFYDNDKIINTSQVEIEGLVR